MACRLIHMRYSEVKSIRNKMARGFKSAVMEPVPVASAAASEGASR